MNLQNTARPLYGSVLLLGLLLGGCVPVSQSAHLAGYDRDISSATKALETAPDDVSRAAAYTRRGGAYSEKARYSRTFKLISLDEYTRLFELSIKDHDQAIAPHPTAEAYYSRGITYYDRAVLEVVVNGNLIGNAATWKFWFDPSAADLRKAIELNARYDLAWDRLGLIHETTGELDDAINDYTQELALNSLGRTRLAEAYCLRGGANEKDQKIAAATADYEKSIVTGSVPDGCSCDPYNSLLALYQKDRRYDQVWAVVHKAQSAGKWIAPDLLAVLQKESGRRN